MAWQEVKEFGKVEKQPPREEEQEQERLPEEQEQEMNEEELPEMREEEQEEALDARQIRAEIGRASRGIHNELSDNVLSMANQARTNPAQQKAILGTIRRMIREANIPEFKE